MLCQRAAFSLPADIHYLNCAYMGPLPRLTEEAGIHAVRTKSNPSRVVAQDFFRDSDELRTLFAKLINAPPTRIAILPSASYGIATVCRNLEFGPGRRIVLAGEQFPGNVYTWRSVASRSGAEVVMVPPPSGGSRGRAWSDRLMAEIDDRTVAVAIGSVHWTDGTRFDLRGIGSRARDVGAAFVVDGTQSVGALPFDVQEIRPDALICASYKWLLGPYSLGLGYFGPRFDEGIPLEETWIARKGSEDFKGLVAYVDEYQPGAVKYDVGERSNFILVPMQVASLRQILEWTPEGIQRYAARLCAELFDELPALGYAVEEPEWRCSHLFGVRMPEGRDPIGVKDALERANVWVSLRGSSLRVSPHVYNDETDTGALLEVLANAVP